MADVMGTTGGDTLRGTAGDDTITAQAGNDIIFGSDGQDSVDGGAGTDTLQFVLRDAALFAPPTGLRTYTLSTGRLVDSSDRIATSFTAVEFVRLDLRLAGDFGDLVDASALTGTGGVTRTETQFGDGDDLFRGSALADTIVAGRGRLTADGGAGVDFAVLTDDGTGAALTFRRSGEIVTGVQNGAELFNLRGIERLQVSAASTGAALFVDAAGLDLSLTMAETAGADTLLGGVASDVFISFATADRDGRADRYTGGGGADLYDFRRNLLAMNGTVIADFGADDQLLLQSFAHAAGFSGVTDAWGLPIGQTISRAAFDGEAGTVRYWSAAGRTTLEYDADGDRRADATLVLDGQFALSWRSTSSNGGAVSDRSLVLDATAAVLNGTAGDDIITGSAGADEIGGLAGDDRIDGGDGADRLYGEDGDDRLVGGAGFDRLDGGDGADTLRGDAGHDTLDGGAGDDVLDGGTGLDSLDGGDGDDSLTDLDNTGAQSWDISYLSGRAGNDTITAANGRYWLDGNEGNDRLTLRDATGSTLDGEDGDDVLRATNVTQAGVYGGDGDDDIGLTRVTGVVDAGDGSDTVRFSVAELTIHLSNGRDLLLPQAGSGAVSVLDFNAGEAGDRIDLSIYGADPFAPGGQLTIAASGPSTVIVHAASGTRFNLNDVRPENLSAYNLGVRNPLYAPVGLTLEDTDHPGSPGSDSELVGADGADTIRGLGGKDVLYGSGGADRLEGGADEDFLDGGSGQDVMLGGTGEDFYVVDDAGDVVVEAAEGGLDSVAASISYALGQHVEGLVLTGTAAATATGNDSDNLLVGNSAANLLIGGAGADTLIGGAGSDQLDGGAGIDIAVFAGARAAYGVARLADGRVRVSGSDGLDLTTGVERFGFDDGTFRLAEQLFSPTLVLASPFFGAAPEAGAWASDDRYPRTLADVNGDGLADIVGFGDAGAYVSLGSAGGRFGPAALAVGQFGAAPEAGAWASADRYPRLLGDVNGDGRADIVGFGDLGAYVSLGSAGGGFGPLTLAIGQFGAAVEGGGWSSDDRFPRKLADVNGDGLADIVGFGDLGTYVSLATGDGGFGPLALATRQFGAAPEAGAWASDDRHPRALADVNGDGRADIVGFGDAGAYVSLATGNGGFGPAKLATRQFGAAGEAGAWTSDDRYPRALADVNGDGLADIVGFGDAGAYVSFATGDGGFGPLTLGVGQFGAAASAGGWVSDDRYPRTLADVNGDGLADIVGFGDAGVYVVYGTDLVLL